MRDDRDGHFDLRTRWIAINATRSPNQQRATLEARADRPGDCGS
jgi:hypothetical protein